MVQCHPGVQGHRGPEGDLGKQGPPQGAGTEEHWDQALSLPLSQPDSSLTCVVNDHVDQKTTTLDLGELSWD